GGTGAAAVGQLAGLLPASALGLSAGQKRRGPANPGPRGTRGIDQCSSSGGMLPPLSASFCSTVLCSQMFICAESAIFSAGQPSSLASSLRAVRLLSKPSSFSRSTMDTFQFNCSLLVAARLSSLALTSTGEMGVLLAVVLVELLVGGVLTGAWVSAASAL